MGTHCISYITHLDFQVLDAVLERGCTFWDTANVYGDSEELIGKW